MSLVTVDCIYLIVPEVHSQKCKLNDGDCQKAIGYECLRCKSKHSTSKGDIMISEGDIFRHFKGKYYIIERIAVDANTNVFVIVYRALYGNRDIWCRTLEDFQESVSIYREDNITGQTIRFAKVEEFVK